MIHPEKTIVFDVDDTLTMGKVWPRGHERANTHVVSALRKLHAKGWYVILQSARGWARPGGQKANHDEIVEEIRLFCERNDVPHHEILLGKPPAKYYIDDRAMTPGEFTMKEYLNEL